jgi:hypothetical protein
MGFQVTEECSDVDEPINVKWSQAKKGAHVEKNQSVLWGLRRQNSAQV